MTVAHTSFVGLRDLLAGPALMLATALISSIIVIFAAMRFLPDLPIFRSLVLRKEISIQESKGNVISGKLVGKEGVASTDLRPSGTVEIEGGLTPK